MTTASINLSQSSKNITDSLVLPAAAQLGLGVIDFSGRAVEGSEQLLKEIKNTIDEVVPGTVRFIGAFILPEAINHPLHKVVSLATRGLTSFVTKGTEWSANSLTFGAPTWLKAGRNYKAASNALLRDDWNNSTEVLARCFAQNCERAVVRSELLNYVSLRRALSNDIEKYGTNSDEANEARGELAKKESVLKSYEDFKNLRLIFEEGLSYIHDHHQEILSLAEKTADRIISETENYYTDRLDSFGSQVTSPWSDISSDCDRFALRNELRDRIALKLKEVFTNSLDEKQVAQALGTASSALMESFGVYRHSLTAAGYAALGTAYYTGGLATLTDGAIDYINGLGGSALSYLGDTAHNVLKSMWDATFGYAGECITDGYNHLVSMLPGPVRTILGLESVNLTPLSVPSAGTPSLPLPTQPATNPSGSHWFMDPLKMVILPFPMLLR